MSRYSNDLRLRVAKKLVKGLTTVGYEEVSKEFDICVKTLKSWYKKLQLGTLYDEVHSGGHPVIYDLVGLKKFVDDNPDKYLREINDEFFGGSASTSGIDDALKKMGISLKKKSKSIKKQMILKN
jgi:transposase